MNRKRFLTALFVLWIALIFLHSLLPASQSEMESGWVVELLYRLFPFRPSPHLIRKLAHFTEFAVLGVLSVAAYGAWRPDRGKGLGTAAGGPLFAVRTGVFVALCDETIQLFVEGRSGEVRDIWIDVAGACTGGLLLFLMKLARRRVRP